jgi:hypothetical protein
MDEIERIRDEIVSLCKPVKIILYGKKHSVSTGFVKDISLCVILKNGDKAVTEKQIYMTIDSDVSFTVLLYTQLEWDRLITDEQSYAHRISEKGTVIYG